MDLTNNRYSIHHNSRIQDMLTQAKQMEMVTKHWQAEKDRTQKLLDLARKELRKIHEDDGKVTPRFQEMEKAIDTLEKSLRW